MDKRASATAEKLVRIAKSSMPYLCDRAVKNRRKTGESTKNYGKDM